jgi:cbb3-type cytochrome oxidase subunit 3
MGYIVRLFQKKKRRRRRREKRLIVDEPQRGKDHNI